VPLSGPDVSSLSPAGGGGAWISSKILCHTLPFFLPLPVYSRYGFFSARTLHLRTPRFGQDYWRFSVSPPAPSGSPFPLKLKSGSFLVYLNTSCLELRRLFTASGHASVSKPTSVARISLRSFRPSPSLQYRALIILFTLFSRLPRDIVNA